MCDAFAKVLLVSLKCCTEKEEAEEAIRCHASSYWLHICHLSHIVSGKSILKYKGSKAGFCRRIRRPKTTSCSWDHHLPSTGNNSRFNLSLFVEWSNFTWGCYQGNAPSGARPMRKTVARHSGNAANSQKTKRGEVTWISRREIRTSQGKEKGSRRMGAGEEGEDEQDTLFSVLAPEGSGMEIPNFSAKLQPFEQRKTSASTMRSHVGVTKRRLNEATRCQLSEMLNGNAKQKRAFLFWADLSASVWDPSNSEDLYTKLCIFAVNWHNI